MQMKRNIVSILLIFLLLLHLQTNQAYAENDDVQETTGSEDIVLDESEMEELFINEDGTIEEVSTEDELTDEEIIIDDEEAIEEASTDEEIIEEEATEEESEEIYEYSEPESSEKTSETSAESTEDEIPYTGSSQSLFLILGSILTINIIVLFYKIKQMKNV